MPNEIVYVSLGDSTNIIIVQNWNLKRAEFWGSFFQNLLLTVYVKLETLF